MTKEEKELLLKDLCARLPYGVKLGFYASATKQTYVCTFLGLEPQEEEPIITKTENGCFYMLAGNVKPYLFPLSSMTNEQQKKSSFEPSLLNAFMNGYISLFEDEEGIYFYYKDGRCFIHNESMLDLFFAPVKIEGYVNIYRNIYYEGSDKYRNSGKNIYSSEEEAKEHKDLGYITTIKIEWEE